MVAQAGGANTRETKDLEKKLETSRTGGGEGKGGAEDIKGKRTLESQDLEISSYLSMYNKIHTQSKNFF